VGCPKSKSLEAIWHTFKGVIAARRAGVDILHMHAIGPALLVPFAKMLGMRVVMTHHGPDYDRQKWGPAARAALRLGERLGCRWADEVICISPTIADSARRFRSKAPHVIPNGAPIPTPAESTSFLQQHDLEPGRYVLAVARFVPEKGLHDVLEAFSRIETDYKLVIAGDADHESDYSRDLKRRAGQNPDVVLTGFVKGGPLEQLYSHAGLFVLASSHEGLPIVLLEALSYGLSVLASDIAANRRVDLPAERYFPVGDVDALADSLAAWIEKGRLSESQRQRQIAAVRDRYNWPDIAARVLEIYRNMIA
jgi:glycosyltransferase involved in cell wall biosynthesis